MEAERVYSDICIWEKKYMETKEYLSEYDIRKVITGIFGVRTEEIADIAVLKKGMTNHSFVFTCRSRKYIIRIPGEGTEKLIHRAREKAVYNELAGKGICDDIVYIDSESGYKIAEYMEGARVCDSADLNDVSVCMKKLRTFHEMELRVEHEFDIFEQIDFYEKLWGNGLSVYHNYRKVKKNVLSLKPYIDAHTDKKVLTHIDAVSDNFLIGKDLAGKEDIRLIDWEYAGMQDPHVDIAMFCIYSMYGRSRVDQIIDMYFSEGCPDETRKKIYCYIAVCGLLWSNWCEYKRRLGVEFGAYALRQFQYAQEYFEILQNEAGGLVGRNDV